MFVWIVSCKKKRIVYFFGKRNIFLFTNQWLNSVGSADISLKLIACLSVQLVKRSEIVNGATVAAEPKQ